MFPKILQEKRLATTAWQSFSVNWSWAREVSVNWSWAIGSYNIQGARQRMVWKAEPLHENQEFCRDKNPASLTRHQRKSIRTFMQRGSQPSISEGSPSKLTMVLHLCIPSAWNLYLHLLCLANHMSSSSGRTLSPKALNWILSHC